MLREGDYGRDSDASRNQEGGRGARGYTKAAPQGTQEVDPVSPLEERQRGRPLADDLVQDLDEAGPGRRPSPRVGVDPQDAVGPGKEWIERSRGFHHDELSRRKGESRRREALEIVIAVEPLQRMHLSLHDPPQTLSRRSPGAA